MAMLNNQMVYSLHDAWTTEKPNICSNPRTDSSQQQLMKNEIIWYTFLAFHVNIHTYIYIYMYIELLPPYFLK